MKCPRSQARRVSRQSKIVVLELISNRMCEKNMGLSSAQDLKPGECRGSQMCLSGANFLIGCVNRFRFVKCPRSPFRKVSRQSKIVPQARNSEHDVWDRIWDYVKCPRFPARKFSRDLTMCQSGANFLKGCVNRPGLWECPRSPATRVSRQSKLFPQERISQRMCEQIGAVEVPKISSQESVEAVKKLSFGCIFPKGCVKRSG